MSRNTSSISFYLHEWFRFEYEICANLQPAPIDTSRRDALRTTSNTNDFAIPETQQFINELTLQEEWLFVTSLSQSRTFAASQSPFLFSDG